MMSTNLPWISRSDQETSRLLTEIKQEILRENHERVGVLTEEFFSSDLNNATLRLFVGVIVSRSVDQISYQEASETLISVAHALTSSHRASSLFAMASLSQAIGCFVASYEFELLAYAALSQSSEAGRLIAAIARRNPEAAIEAWKSLRRQRLWGNKTAKDAGHYLWLWTGGEHGQQKHSAQRRWAQTIRQHPIGIIGPAPISTPLRLPHNALIARVLAPGVTSWPEDSGNGKCQLGYANNKSTKWFATHTPADFFSTFMYVSFRTARGKELSLDNGRLAHHHKNLLPMPWDKTNMIPLIAWDLSHAHTGPLHITGVNFFASRNAYSPHELRFKEERSRATDVSGSTGMRFERCASFSNHAVGFHLSFMANLVEAGFLNFDEDGSAVLRNDTREYYMLLDDLYGRNQV